VLLSRSEPELVDAQYTKNQAWKSDKVFSACCGATEQQVGEFGVTEQQVGELTVQTV